MKTEDKAIRTSIGMKFLLTIGVFSTVFCVFQLYQMWTVSRRHIDGLLESRTKLAMTFHQAIHNLDQSENNGNTDSDFLPIPEISEEIKQRFPDLVFRHFFVFSEDPAMRPGREEQRIIDLFVRSEGLESWSGRWVLNGQPHSVRFAPHRNEKGDIIGLDMTGFPVAPLEAAANDELLNKMQTQMLSLLGFFGAVFASFELLAGRRIRRIAEHFRCFSASEELVHIDPLKVKGRDEIGLLVESFNRLADRRNTLYQHLQKLVLERTAELEEANRQLRHQVEYCRQAEEQAHVLANEAKAANRTKSEFLANMSHEIRTPMNAIMGFGEILAEEEVSDEQRKYIQLILNSSRNLLAIINDILDYSKIEAGRMTVEIADCHLGLTLNEIDSLLRPGAKKKQLAFEVLQCGELPGLIQTDPVRLRQCLINLVGNAIKFTEQGHVFLNVSMQTIDDQHFVRFDVEDTGIGIPTDKQGMIFDSFSQADSATTRKYGGTGLGLAITRRLAELLGGRIFLESQVGKGSIFSLVIPAPAGWQEESTCNKYQAIDDSAIVEEAKGMKMSGKILVAEDNPSNQKLITILLQKMGVEVTIAEDGQQAVNKALSETYDLILMDMQMPNLNGYDATRQLRSKNCIVPIIAVTANAMMGDEEKCLSAGCDGYLSKPIDRNKLNEVVSRYIAVHA